MGAPSQAASPFRFKPHRGFARRFAPTVALSASLLAQDIRELQKMAGDPKAQRELGLRRESGDGVAMSKLEAARWYRRAAEKEGANAQNGLAMRREFGDGPPQRDAQAIKWPKMAAEGGRLQAMRDLAPLIEKEGSETSRQAAMGWCRKAAQAAENAAGAKTSAMTSAMNKGEDVREGGAMEPSPALAQNQALSSAPAQTPPQAKAQTPSQS